MAEDDIPKFNLKASAEFIHEKVGGAGKCPICSNESWVVETGQTANWFTDDPQPAPGYVMKDPRSFWGPGPSIPTFILTCKKCGFIRQHNLAWIADQLDDIDGK